MSLETIVYTLEEQLTLLGRQLLAFDPQHKQHEKAERLRDEMQMVLRGLKAWQKDLMTVRKRLTDNQIAATLLLSRIEACLRTGRGEEAYKLALELEELRKQVAADTDRIPKMEQTCWSLQFRVRQLRRDLTRLTEGEQA
jgi:hypothetical protein